MAFARFLRIEHAERSGPGDVILHVGARHVVVVQHEPEPEPLAAFDLRHDLLIPLVCRRVQRQLEFHDVAGALSQIDPVDALDILPLGNVLGGGEFLDHPRRSRRIEIQIHFLKEEPVAEKDWPFVDRLAKLNAKPVRKPFRQNCKLSP